MIPDSKRVLFSLHCISKYLTTTEHSSQAPEAWILIQPLPSVYPPLLYSPYFIWKHFFLRNVLFPIYVTPLLIYVIVLRFL
jgi:hypothetical protein